MMISDQSPIKHIKKHFISVAQTVGKQRPGSWQGLLATQSIQIEYSRLRETLIRKNKVQSNKGRHPTLILSFTYMCTYVQIQECTCSHICVLMGKTKVNCFIFSRVFCYLIMYKVILPPRGLLYILSFWLSYYTLLFKLSLTHEIFISCTVSRGTRKWLTWKETINHSLKNYIHGHPDDSKQKAIWFKLFQCISNVSEEWRDGQNINWRMFVFHLLVKEVNSKKRRHLVWVVHEQINKSTSPNNCHKIKSPLRQ